MQPLFLKLSVAFPTNNHDLKTWQWLDDRLLQNLDRFTLFLRVGREVIRTTSHFDVFSLVLILVLAIGFLDTGMPGFSPTIILKKAGSSECSEPAGRINKLETTGNALTDTHKTLFPQSGGCSKLHSQLSTPHD